jgi:hypothetical protein
MKYWDIKYFDDKFTWKSQISEEIIMSFSKVSTSLHTKCKAGTNLADGDFVR